MQRYFVTSPYSLAKRICGSGSTRTFAWRSWLTPEEIAVERARAAEQAARDAEQAARDAEQAAEARVAELEREIARLRR